jgi:hypothetical protein
MPIMTAQQAFNVSMNEHPSLYASRSLEEAQIKYYDHIFNVIGNGYRDMKEFRDGHKITPQNAQLTESFPEKYITDKPLFWAYTEVDESYGFKRGKENSSLPGVYTKKELEAMPEVVHTLQSNKRYKGEDYSFNPYPNFKKEYSLVWDDISKLDKSWPEAALVFYKKCQDYFNSDKVSNYHYACPKDTETDKWQTSIESFEKNFARYKTEGMTQDEYYKKVSKEYEVEYTGDTKDFIKRRWEKEHTRINEFLNETIDRLENMLTPQITPKSRKKAI